ncbi:hypothetical protein QBC42DRAFT_231687 [Cladorrhinum samala]|uniref:Rhodopsin domain-containing protein n=1 Tax=Cladorrhinum samala TaxID=585594 RepID=A0AAV9HF44_9PEZI|nr:hypothetical protein QBC42DRAFT_231687 [Cladorrhinum samala]
MSTNHFIPDPSTDYGPQLNTAVWILVSLSSVFLFTRLYLKQCQNRGLWWDDHFLLASWLLLVAQAALVAHVISLGYGRQVIPPRNFGRFPAPINALSTLLIVSNLFGKLSFALTLLRIPARWLRAAVWWIVVSLTATLTLSTVLVWVTCEGRNLRPDGSIKCVSAEMTLTYNIFSCVYSAVMDVALAFLPWKFLWELQMSRKEKIGVVVAMSMGVFAGAAAAIKSSTFLGFNQNADPTASVPLVIWGNAEAAICIIAASIPILRALARGGSRGPVPRGYDTYLTNAMTETGASGADALRTRVVSLAPPIQPPSAAFDARKIPSRNNLEALDKTLTSDSPEPVVGFKQVKDDLDDANSFEMTDYHHTRPQSPADFVRG